MPNKCTMCGKVHPDDAKYLLDGCDKCGSKFFFYVREESLQKAEEGIAKLTKKDIEEIEDDIRHIIPKGVKKDETVILDIEAINIIKPGKYEIDVTNLFTQKPIIIRAGSGKYEIDLSTLLGKWKEMLASHVRVAKEAEAQEEAERKAKEAAEETETDEEAKEEKDDDYKEIEAEPAAEEEPKEEKEEPKEEEGSEAQEKGEKPKKDEAEQEEKDLNSPDK